MALAHEVRARMLYGDAPVYRPPVGWSDDMAAVDEADLRQLAPVLESGASS